MVLAVQALTGFYQSFFFLFVNSWDNSCFDEAFSSDDGYLGFLVDYVFSEQSWQVVEVGDWFAVELYKYIAHG